MLLQVESKKLAAAETVLLNQLQTIARAARVIESTCPELWCAINITEREEEGED